MCTKLLLQSELKCILINFRTISKTSVQHLNQKWRKERGLPLDPNSYGVLTDTPDYTFLDGRPTSYGIGQKRRMMEQKEIAEQIIALTKEMDFAVERHKKLVDDEVKNKEAMINNKLKPKGVMLLKKK